MFWILIKCVNFLDLLDQFSFSQLLSVCDETSEVQGYYCFKHCEYTTKHVSRFYVRNTSVTFGVAIYCLYYYAFEFYPRNYYRKVVRVKQ